MESLEKKDINGHTYYYYTKRGWVNGKNKRIWQKYLGKLDDIVKAVEGVGPTPLYAEVFEHGLSTALWSECQNAQVISQIDKQYSKRKQGVSIGEYLAISALNRAIHPVSKNCLWDWFSKTTLLRYLPNATKERLSSQSFWNHMDKISSQAALPIWKGIITNVLKRENIDLSSVSYDGTNFYTFMDTFTDFSCTISQKFVTFFQEKR